MCSEGTFGNHDPLLSQSFTNSSDQRFGVIRRSRCSERRPSPAAQVPLERELAHDQDSATDIRNGSVHLQSIIGEDPQSGNLAHGHLDVSDAVTYRNAHEQKHPLANLADDNAVDNHTSLRNPLHHCAHCISAVLVHSEPTLVPMIRSVLLSLVRGFVMGAADIVPGVSGGTIALIFGIYERLIASIRAGSLALGNLLKGDIPGFRRWMKEVDWLFIIPLGVGILLAIVALAHVVERLLLDQAVVMAALFMGLVAGSIVVAWGMIKKRETRHIWIAVAVAVAVFIALGLRGGTSEDTVGQILDPQLWAFFLAGALAITAMILPGISGSFILVLLGMYGPLLNAVTSRDFLALAVFTLGAIIGLALFSQVLHRALTLHHDAVIAALVGLMAGSLRVLWPWPLGVDSTALGAPDSHILAASVVAIGAFVAVIVVSRFAQRLEADDHPASAVV